MASAKLKKTTTEYFKETTEEIYYEEQSRRATKRYAHVPTSRKESYDWGTLYLELMKCMGHKILDYRDCHLKNDMNDKRKNRGTDVKLNYGSISTAAVNYVMDKFYELDKDPMHPFKFAEIENWKGEEHFRGALLQRIQKMVMYAEFETCSIETETRALIIVRSDSREGKLVKYGIERLTVSAVTELNKATA